MDIVTEPQPMLSKIDYKQWLSKNVSHFEDSYRLEKELVDEMDILSNRLEVVRTQLEVVRSFLRFQPSLEKDSEPVSGSPADVSINWMYVTTKEAAKFYDVAIHKLYANPLLYGGIKRHKSWVWPIKK